MAYLGKNSIMYLAHVRSLGTTTKCPATQMLQCTLEREAYIKVQVNKSGHQQYVGKVEPEILETIFLHIRPVLHVVVEANPPADRSWRPIRSTKTSSISSSVTRLGDFWTILASNFATNVPQIFDNFLYYY